MLLRRKKAVFPKRLGIIPCRIKAGRYGCVPPFHLFMRRVHEDKTRDIRRILLLKATDEDASEREAYEDEGPGQLGRIEEIVHVLDDLADWV
jgi:hypothetical protein